MSETKLYTLGKLALKLGVQAFVLQRMANRGAIPFMKADRFHVFTEEHIPAIRAALVKAGYLKPESEPVARAA